MNISDETIERAARAMTSVVWGENDPVTNGDRLAARAALTAAAPLLMAQALREAADAWLHGAWGNTPRHKDRIADRIGAGQYAGDWMRARAEQIKEQS